MTLESDVRSWFITGVSSGLGLHLARAALARGDRVAGTVRTPEQAATFEKDAPGRARAFLMDATDAAPVSAAVRDATDAFGRIDIAVNNAGCGLLAALEESSDAQIERILAVNLLAPLRVMRALTSSMRANGGGHVMNITAIAGAANHVGFAAYGAAKAGLESASEAFAEETAPFGIKVTLVIPGPVRTDFIARSLEMTDPLPEYRATVGKFGATLRAINGKQTGDPAKCAAVILAIAGTTNPPRRLLLGKYAHDRFAKKIAELSAQLEASKPLGLVTDF